MHWSAWACFSYNASTLITDFESWSNPARRPWLFYRSLDFCLSIRASYSSRLIFDWKGGYTQQTTIAHCISYTTIHVHLYIAGVWLSVIYEFCDTRGMCSLLHHRSSKRCAGTWKSPSRVFFCHTFDKRQFPYLKWICVHAKKDKFSKCKSERLQCWSLAANDTLMRTWQISGYT